jgi:hypothetical protein
MFEGSSCQHEVVSHSQMYYDAIVARSRLKTIRFVCSCMHWQLPFHDGLEAAVGSAVLCRTPPVTVAGAFHTAGGGASRTAHGGLPQSKLCGAHSGWHGQ